MPIIRITQVIQTLSSHKKKTRQRIEVRCRVLVLNVVTNSDFQLRCVRQLIRILAGNRINDRGDEFINLLRCTSDEL